MLQLLRYTVIISIRLLTFSLSIRQKLLHDLIILCYKIFYAENIRQQNS